jgi:phage terminase large subunit-like protein
MKNTSIQTNQVEIEKWIKNSKLSNTSNYILLAQQRFLNDSKSKKYVVDWELLDRMTNFFELFHHYTGKFNNEKFILSTWQKFFLVNVFCIKDVKTKKRKYQQVYCQIARKNGKSSFISILALWSLLADGEANAQVVVSANTCPQADIVFKMANTYLRQITKKGKTYRTSKIQIEDNELFIVSSDASVQDGLNPSTFIIDEYHAAKNNDMVNVLKTGQGGRAQPLMIILTTAGLFKGICYSFRNYCIEVLTDQKNDEILFPLIFELNPDDDPYEEKNWIKANPNLNITVSSSFIENQLIQAKQDITQTSNILTKVLNIWQDNVTTWIPEEFIKNSFITESQWMEKLKEKPNQLYLGCDLAAVSDLNAISYMFYLNGIFYFNIKYYLPQNFNNYQQNISLYSNLAANNMLTFTSGNVIDFNVIVNDIIKMCEYGRIVYLFYDPYNARTFIDLCKAVKIHCEPFSQTIGSFNVPTKELQRQLLSGNIRFVENELIIRNFRDVTIMQDHNQNEKPSKKDYLNQKIDGVIASIEAMAAWILDPKRKK